MLIVMGKVVLKEIFLKVHINTRIYVILEFQHFEIGLLKNFGQVISGQNVEGHCYFIASLMLLSGTPLISPDA